MGLSIPIPIPIPVPVAVAVARIRSVAPRSRRALASFWRFSGLVLA